MTRTRYRICETTHPYFLTCTVVGWTPVFTRPEIVQIVLDSWQLLQEHRRLALYGYVILEDHLHMIASSVDLAKEVRAFKSFVARKIIDFLEAQEVHAVFRQLRLCKAKHKIDREYQFWQEESHSQMIQDDEMMWQKLEYIHNNPVKRGYVLDPIDWRYSSARNYAGQPGPIAVTTDW